VCKGSVADNTGNIQVIDTPTIVSKTSMNKMVAELYSVIIELKDEIKRFKNINEKLEEKNNINEEQLKNINNQLINIIMDKNEKIKELNKIDSYIH
jgi:hypothetical protein